MISWRNFIVSCKTQPINLDFFYTNTVLDKTSLILFSLDSSLNSKITLHTDMLWNLIHICCGTSTTNFGRDSSFIWQLFLGF